MVRVETSEIRRLQHNVNLLRYHLAEDASNADSHHYLSMMKEKLDEAEKGMTGQFGWMDEYDIEMVIHRYEQYQESYQFPLRWDEPDSPEYEDQYVTKLDDLILESIRYLKSLLPKGD